MNIDFSVVALFVIITSVSEYLAWYIVAQLQAVIVQVYVVARVVPPQVIAYIFTLVTPLTVIPSEKDIKLSDR